KLLRTGWDGAAVGFADPRSSRRSYQSPLRGNHARASSRTHFTIASRSCGFEPTFHVQAKALTDGVGWSCGRLRRSSLLSAVLPVAASRQPRTRLESNPLYDRFAIVWVRTHLPRSG